MAHGSSGNSVRTDVVEGSMDEQADRVAVLSLIGSSDLGNSLAPILETDQWQVKPLTLSQNKAWALWREIEKHPMLFNDFTRGRPEIFFGYLTLPESYWLEIWTGDALSGIVGIFGFTMTDAEAHIMALDRRPHEKLPAYKAVLRHVFETFPLERLSVQVPAFYFATARLAAKLGFVKEGTKRRCVLVGGKRIDVDLFGILREEGWD